MKTRPQTLANFCTGLFFLSSGTLSAQWVAFNDHAPGGGTHVNATRYHAYANGYPSSGQLKNISNGTNLNVRVAITRSGSEIAGRDAAAPALGTPLHTVFNGFVDFFGSPDPNIELQATMGQWVIYTFTGLDPSKRYRFHGSAIRGGDSTYANRWLVCELAGGMLSCSNAHSAHVVTQQQEPSLMTNEALLQTGINNTAATGDYVCWDNIQPSMSGSFAVNCHHYKGPVPGGSSAGIRTYALTGIRLEEISSAEQPVAIVSQPQDQIVYEGGSASFSADVTGNPIFYQWIRNEEVIEEATNRVFAISSATMQDDGLYWFIASNGLNSVTSSPARLMVVVPQIVEWGRNDYGQVTVPFGLNSVLMMAAGSWHSLALQGDGTIVGWGRNSEGQLNIPGDVRNPASIAAGYFSSYAIMPDGTLRCWGDNAWGAVSPPAGLSNVVMIAPGYDHALALRADGTVAAWGRDLEGQSSVPAGLSNVVKVFAGGYGSFALKANGTVTAWGQNTYGQLNVPPALTNLVALAAANFHTLGLTREGRVYAWGNNNYGQCSVPAGLSNVVAIAVGGGYAGSHSLALKEDGTVVAWGYSSSGQGTVPATVSRAVRIAGGEYYSAVMNSRDATVPGPVLLPSPFVMGVLGQHFQHRLVVRNGPVSFTASGLPPGMALDTGTGLMSGVPSSVGIFEVVLSVTNYMGGDQRTMTLIIQSNSLPPVVIVDPVAFPLSANQRGTVLCLGTSGVSYDAYLPPGYSTNGAPLPILYTMNPDGGGMVGQFQSVCAELKMIVIGITGSRNGAPWDVSLKEFYAVSRDIRQRVLFDPTAVFTAGFSGGGLTAYVLSRAQAQHVAGVFAMSGWMGRNLGTYYSTDKVQTNLLVARAKGTSENTGSFVTDSNFLASCGAVIQDWSFVGGHSVAPDSVKLACLSWLLTQRVPSAPGDRANALMEAAAWRAHVNGGEKQTVLRECVAALMNHPRSWRALQAQLVLDELMSDYNYFRALLMDNLADGDFASDLFYYGARGAANVGDWPKYHSCLKALTGVSGACGDRAGDIRDLLLLNWWAEPVVHVEAETMTSLYVWLAKDAPGLGYSLKERSSLNSGPWEDVATIADQTGTSWGTELNVVPEVTNKFYRVLTTPTLVTNSPPWP